MLNLTQWNQLERDILFLKGILSSTLPARDWIEAEQAQIDSPAQTPQAQIEQQVEPQQPQVEPQNEMQQLLQMGPPLQIEQQDEQQVEQQVEQQDEPQQPQVEPQNEMQQLLQMEPLLQIEQQPQVEPQHQIQPQSQFQMMLHLFDPPRRVYNHSNLQFLRPTAPMQSNGRPILFMARHLGAAANALIEQPPVAPLIPAPPQHMLQEQHQNLNKRNHSEPDNQNDDDDVDEANFDTNQFLNLGNNPPKENTPNRLISPKKFKKP